MKMKIVLTAIFALVCAVSAVSAQNKATDFSGTWSLDVSKSKLDGQMRIESMTMTVSQTDKDIKIDSSTKRAERPESDQRNGMSGGGMGGMRRGGGGFGGDSTATYTLDGKETVNDLTSSAGGKITLKATLEKDGKLKLVQTREFETQMGTMTMKTTEVWSLSSDGKTLTVKRDRETPRGSNSTEMIFTKQ